MAPTPVVEPPALELDRRTYSFVPVDRDGADGPLTTNDVRVLRLLFDRGPHTYGTLLATLHCTTAGVAPALRRLRSLGRRGLIRNGRTVAVDGAHLFEITGEGARQLRRADEAAYGRHA